MCACIDKTLIYSSLLFPLLYVICEHQEEEDDLEEIDPTAIRSRRTRGVKVDYTSAEALAKAGLKPGEDDDE